MKLFVPLMCAAILQSAVHATGDITFCPIKDIHPTQVRYSSANVEEKKKKALKSHKPTDPLLLHDDGKSLFGAGDAVPVIQVNTQYYLIDGHHTVLASKACNASTVPVKIEKVYAGPVDEAFWKWAEEGNFAYRRSCQGVVITPTSFDTLEDDPLRYFAAITARKFEKTLEMAQSTGDEYPLWVKIYKDVPFIEFKIADVLRTAGFSYQYGDEKDAKKFDTLREQARAILRDTPVRNLKGVPHRDGAYDQSPTVKGFLKAAGAQ